MNKKQREQKKSKRLVLSPMLPRQHNARKRAEIRAQETAILRGGK